MHNWFKTIEEIPKIFAEGAFLIAFFYCLIIATKLFHEGQKQKKIQKLATLSAKSERNRSAQEDSIIAEHFDQMWLDLDFNEDSVDRKIN